MHYTPNGRETVDRSQLGVWFYPLGEEPEERMSGRCACVFPNTWTTIPAHDPAFEQTASIIIENDAHIHSYLPHMHFRGKRMRFFADYPDGTTEDGISTIQGVTHTLTLVGTGVTATAVTGIITSGGIRFINVTNRGGGYGEIPTVAISSAPSTGITGIATATMIGGINVCNLNANPRLQSVQTVPITNPGAGYTVAPKIKFYGGKGGTGAAATSGIADGTVGIITVSSGGSGYTTAPSISLSNEIFLSGVSTSSAQLITVLNAAGTVTEIRITNAGLGYSACLLYTSPSPRDATLSRMPSSA